jgi:cell division protease FtsH
MAEFESAKDKVMMGAERRSMVMSEKEKELTAYHEAGHALIAIHAPGHDPLHKVTIIPRGRALGVTMSLPEKDRLSMTRQELEARICMAFGGRISEELVFGPEEVTTGASNDIMQATNLARRMVTEWGMSDRLGPLRYAGDQDEVFLGHSVTQRKSISDDTARIIDEEIRAIIDAAETAARNILTTHRDQLNAIAEALLEHETLSGDQVRRVVAGEKLDVSDAGGGSTPKPEAPGPRGGGGRRSTIPSAGPLGGVAPQPGSAD